MPTDKQPRSHLCLVARDGRRVDSRAGEVRPIDGVVAPEDVVFVDLTEIEERATHPVLPGGRRFRLTLVR